MAENVSLRAPVIFMLDLPGRESSMQASLLTNLAVVRCPCKVGAYTPRPSGKGLLFMTAKAAPVAIIMGSRSDWPVLKHAAEMLQRLGVDYEAKVVSAHRTPDRMYSFAKGAKSAGVKVIIAAAGG